MSTLQTLDRGLRALELVSQRPDGISVSELATELGVHRAICYRIVATLEEHLLVTRTTTGRVRLGVGLTALATWYEPAFRRDAAPILDQLADDMQATAFLSVAEGKECVAMMVAEPRDAVLTVGYRIGSRHPLGQGAAGVAILATRPESPEDSEAVRTARANGYSLTRGQLERGAVGLASGIRIAGPVGVALERSVGVVAINDLDVDRAAKTVRRAADNIEALLRS
ncbi:helix-turn-helix domain-containing protein [Streptomyces sp. NPDC050625]|uniref:IclR family transcriptional regulator n=1 Tax=Streptomyces sp. NPDC050625 TaxID=3154629 RepID=UPI003437010D